MTERRTGSVSPVRRVCIRLALAVLCLGAVRPAAAQAARYVDMMTFRKERAHTLNDMRVLQEDMRLLLTRLEALEQEKQEREAVLRALQEQLALTERRFQALEKQQQESEARLRGEVFQAAEQQARLSREAAQQAVDGLRTAMAGEVSRVEQIAVRAVNRPVPPRAGSGASPSGAWVEFRVQAGDTIGAIARQAGVSVQTLQQLNGLKGTTIRVGQILKVPVPQP